MFFNQCFTNNFEIQNDISTTIGYGCYLNGSGFNHSCWPNSIYSFSGNRLVLRALKTIEPTDSVYINYIDTLQLRADRKSLLREQYLFECQCEACTNDDLERAMSELPCSQPDCKGFAILSQNLLDYQCNKCNKTEDSTTMNMHHAIMKAKLFHINNLMLNNEYSRAYELAMRELNEFHVDYHRESSGGLYQLCFGEKAFESAIFLQEYEAAFEICRLKSGYKSWIHQSLVKFLGTENHPIAKNHFEKFQKLIEYCGC